MEIYANVLLWVIPIFFVLILLEIIYGYIKKNQTHTFMDTLSSLSSGMTNILKDVLGLVVIVISYPFLLDNLSIYSIENSLIIYPNHIHTYDDLIETVIHEYQHYLQSPTWMERYYNMGYDYQTHPYEVQAEKVAKRDKNLCKKSIN